MSWRFWLSNKTVRKFEELPIHCQQQNCSPGNLVSSKVWFIWIFAGVRWRGCVKWVWGRRKWRFRFFRSLYLPNLHIHGHKLNDLEWSFCVKIWFELGIQWVDVLNFWLSEKTVRKFAELRIECQRHQNVSQRLYCWYKCYRVIHWGYRRGSVKPVNCIHIHSTVLSLTHVMLFTDFCRK